MKAFTISAAVALLAAIAHAAPAPAQVNARSFNAVITFEGADYAALYVRDIPTDGRLHAIDDNLSVSHIMGDSRAKCTFYGTEGSITTVVGAETVDVGPPQPQASGSCTPL